MVDLLIGVLIGVFIPDRFAAPTKLVCIRFYHKLKDMAEQYWGKFNSSVEAADAELKARPAEPEPFPEPEPEPEPDPEDPEDPEPQDDEPAEPDKDVVSPENSSPENSSPENFSPENSSPEKFPDDTESDYTAGTGSVMELPTDPDVNLDADSSPGDALEPGEPDEPLR